MNMKRLPLLEPHIALQEAYCGVGINLGSNLQYNDVMCLERSKTYKISAGKPELHCSGFLPPSNIIFVPANYVGMLCFLRC